MDRAGILELLGERWNQMLECISSGLDTNVPLLREVNGQVLSHNGKMLRPMISLLVAGATGTINDSSVRYAAASEMLHNATLIHDDVADESKQRRGNPTVASMVGPSSAVLVGDFWLARAVELVTDVSLDREAVKIFSRTLTNLAEGEMLQLEKAAECDTTEEDYMRIIHCKTASLFESAAISAALSTDAPKEYVDASAAYARAFGMAFQIKDDILDYVGDEALGKPVGIDIREKKITLPLLGALSGCAEEKEIRKRISQMEPGSAYPETVREFVLSNGGIEYASSVLDRFVSEAQSALAPLPDSLEKRYLSEIAEYNSFRRA